MAKNCNSGRAKEPPDARVVLYKFPKSARISNRWIRGLRLSKWSPKPTSVVCSLHFQEDCFLPGTFNDPLQRPKLKPNAVPTIFDNDKKKTVRKPPKNRTIPAKPKFSSLFPGSSEKNEQDVEMTTSQDDSGIIASKCSLRYSKKRTYISGNVLARMQRVHEPPDLRDITFCTR